jgi:hypothetical protein
MKSMPMNGAAASTIIAAIKRKNKWKTLDFDIMRFHLER